MNLFFTSCRLKYFILARHKRGHGIHSPFVFNLFSDIFLNKHDPEIVKTIVDSVRLLQKGRFDSGDNYRFSCLLDFPVYHKSLWGARTGESRKSGKYYHLLMLLARRVEGSPVLQLGIDPHMTAINMALGAAGSQVVLVERLDKQGISAERMKKAEDGAEKQIVIFQDGDRNSDINREENIGNEANVFINSNIEIRVIDSYEKLDQITGEMRGIGLAMISAEWCRDKLIHCFDTVARVATEETIVVIGDIHKSAKIEKDWHKMINDNRVSVSIDLLRYGLVFFRHGIAKQHFLIRY